MNQNAGLIQQVFWDPTDTKKTVSSTKIGI